MTEDIGQKGFAPMYRPPVCSACRMILPAHEQNCPKRVKIPPFPTLVKEIPMAGREAAERLEQDARPMTELERYAQEALNEQREAREKSRNGGPDGYSEIDRELTLLAGVFTSVNRAAAELAAYLETVSDGGTELAVREKTEQKMPQVETEVGLRIRRLYEEASELSDFLHTTKYRLRIL